MQLLYQIFNFKCFTMLYWFKNFDELLYFKLGSPLITYFIVAGLAYFILLKWKRQDWKNKRIQSQFPEKKTIIREIKWAMLTVALATVINLFIYYAFKNGYTIAYSDISEYGWFYFFFSIVIFIFIHDTYFYWLHRFLHTTIPYKLIHRAHHIFTNPSPWCARSFHPIEAIGLLGIYPVILFLIPAHPYALSLFSIFAIAFNAYGHSGYELYPAGFTKHWLGKYVNTSTHHNMHHEFYEENYGLYFLFWDKWMGTLNKDYYNRFDEVKAKSSKR